MSAAKLKVGATLGAARAEFSGHGRLIFRLTLLFSVLNGASALLLLLGSAGWAVSIGIAVLLGAIYTGMITALVCLRTNEQREAGELWEAVRPVLSRLVWVTLVALLGVLVGMSAFIVPGLILATFWSVSAQAVMVERQPVFAALGRSFALVRGNAWPAFGFLAIMGMISILLLLLVLVATAPLGTGVGAQAIASALGNFVSTPLLAVASAVLYNRLAELDRAAGGPDAPEEGPGDGLPPDHRP